MTETQRNEEKEEEEEEDKKGKKRQSRSTMFVSGTMKSVCRTMGQEDYPEYRY